MRKHAIPGEIAREWMIPSKSYTAFLMTRGQTLRVVDLEGKQVPDIVCFNSHDHGEVINLATTQVLNTQLELTSGAIIYSQLCNPMMTIAGYSNDLSFAYGPMCSEELNRLRYGVAGTQNCRDNFTHALASWGFNRKDIPNAFVPFMRVELDEEGTLEIKEPTTVPGDYYDIRADMDLLVAISNCPQELNPCNGFNPTPTGVVIYDS